VAPCCRDYYVAVDAWDVFRIARALHLGIGEIASLRWRDAADHEFRILLDGAAPAAERTRFYSLSLGKVPDPGGPGEHGERCVFLLDIGGRGRCGIYAVRPSVCRCYPTGWREGVLTTDGGGRYCPPGAWNVEGIDLELFRDRWHEHRLHRWIHQELVDGWNERLIADRAVREADAFFAYLVRFYEVAVASEPSLFERRPLVGWPHARVAGMVDRTLRALGWRTDATLAAREPLLGWSSSASAPARLSLRGEAEGTAAGVIVLDPDEDIDPEGAHLAALVRR
jgi:Fe-S-cluster containining protein